MQELPFPRFQSNVARTIRKLAPTARNLNGGGMRGRQPTGKGPDPPGNSTHVPMLVGLYICGLITAIYIADEEEGLLCLANTPSREMQNPRVFSSSSSSSNC